MKTSDTNQGERQGKGKLGAFVGFTASHRESRAYALAANAQAGGNKAKWLRDALAEKARPFMPKN